MNEKEREMAILKGMLPQPTTGWKASGNFTQADADACNTAELEHARRELAEARATAAELLAACKALRADLKEQCQLSGSKWDKVPSIAQARAAIARAEGRAQ